MTRKIDEKTTKFQNDIRAYIESITTDTTDENNNTVSALYELKTYENIANCVTLKYKKHVITDVYYTTSNIRLSTKSVFFTSDDLSDKKNVEKLCETFDDCNIIKNVTDFQIRTSKKSDLQTVIKKAKKFYDDKEKEKLSKKNNKSKKVDNDKSTNLDNDNKSNESESVKNA